MNKSSASQLYKILSHPERLAILKRLMAAQATLTQLGAYFKKSPAHIRHHLVVLEQAGLVEFAEARPVQGGPEKYYRATQQALFIHESILPELSPDKVTLTIGSIDTGIQQIANHLAAKKMPVSLFPVPLSSLDGLIALHQGLCQMSTCHLIDPQTEEYNRSFVRHLFPGQRMALIEIYRREEGLMVLRGNPHGIRSLEDLARAEIQFMNREPGSGVRQWLDYQLRRQGILPERIRGYANIASSHKDVARAVQEGKADAGIGIEACAREYDLEFLPLFEEPYEIVAPKALLDDDRYSPFFEYLNTGKFRSTIRSLDGYHVPQTSGKVEII